MNPESFGVAHYRCQRGIAFTSLYAAHVGPMDLSPGREIFLRIPLFRPQSPDDSPKLDALSTRKSSGPSETWVRKQSYYPSVLSWPTEVSDPTV